MSTPLPTLDTLLSDYRALELSAHASLDDVMNKVTQEVSEILEALESNNPQEVAKEAADALVNVLSVSSALGTLPAIPERPATRPTDRQLLIHLGRWNDSIQTLRGRYTRKAPDLETAKELTQTLVRDILSYIDPMVSPEDIIRDSTEKLSKRVDAYHSDINLRDFVTVCPDFPKPGILFRDISPLLASPEAMCHAVYELATQCRDVDVIAGLDARGFLFGIRVAEVLGKPFVMIRKKGKLPGQTVRQDYTLEYGTSTIEVQEGSIAPGQKVALIDDLLATGGTMRAAADLVEQVGGVVQSILCVISLDEPFLRDQPARQSLSGYPQKNLLHFS